MRYLVLFLLAVLLISFEHELAIRPFQSSLFSEMPYVRDIAMTADEREMFFTVDDHKHSTGFICTSTRKRKKWSKPKIVSFSGNYRDIEPALSSDGLKLYFASNRPLEGLQTGIKDYDIYYVQREAIGKPWSHPYRLSTAINTELDEFYPSIATNGSIYFTRMNEADGTKEDIYVASWKGKEYQTAVPVSGSLNTEFYEFNAYVRPDESYMLFTSYRVRDGRGRNDLYISFNEDGQWGPGRLIPDIHSDAIDYCPFVSSDEEYLYFTSERSELPVSYEQQQELGAYLEHVNSIPNGSGRIYWIPWLTMKKWLWETRKYQMEEQ